MFAFFLISSLFGLFVLACIALASIFWIVMLIHAVTNNGLATGEKIAWVLVILFLHFIGALLYLCIGFGKAT